MAMTYGQEKLRIFPVCSQMGKMGETGPMDVGTRRAWGPVIRKERRAQGLHQEDLAQLAKTTRRTVGSIERGDTAGQAEVLKRILAVLGLETEPDLDREVAGFLDRLGSLLQRLDPDTRARAMSSTFEYVADLATGVHTVDRGPIARRADEQE